MWEETGIGLKGNMSNMENILQLYAVLKAVYIFRN